MKRSGILVVPQLRADAIADILDDFAGGGGNWESEFYYYVQGPSGGWRLRP